MQIWIVPAALRRCEGLARGLLDALPMIPAIAVFGVVFGTAAGEQGLSWLQTAAASALLFSGASQVALLAMWPHLASGGLLPLLVATLLISLRFIPMAATLSGLWYGLPRPAAYVASFLLIDETWALTLRGTARGRPELTAAFIGAGLVLYAVWVVSTAFGRSVPLTVAPERFALDLVIPAMLMVVLARPAKRADAVPAVVGAAVAWLMLPLGSPAGLLAGAAAGGLAGFCQPRGRA